MKISTKRFSDRIEDYVKYRPVYPIHVVSILKNKFVLDELSIIADIGSGTGISSKLFIDNGNKVYGVEPNKQMREAAELFFLENKNFVSISGTAEETNLPNKSIDLIFSGQAFHWFDKNSAKKEFNRILKKEGHIVLAWNERDEKDDFQKEYEKILQQIPEYAEVNHKNISGEEISTFFSPAKMHKESIENLQIFNLESLKGRLRSSSYFPKQGKLHENIMRQIEGLFYKFEKNRVINFLYETNIYWR
jgi:ubiquinone/menaquinone biosynthesis C-methylase UbiE